MQIINDKDLANFFTDYPLYSKIQLFDTFDKGYEFKVFEYFENKAYKFYCPIEKDYHTFKIDRIWGRSYEINENDVPEFYRNKSDKIGFSFHLISNCQSCGFKMDLLLNIFSEKTVDYNNAFPSIFIRKIGQLPAFKRNPEKEVVDYLNEEDKENYSKALSNLSMSYGIGAFAYFRRIIENEIKRLVKDISQLDFEDSDKVKTAWIEYEKNHQMSNLITSINPHIPKSLKEIGDNPIRLLHDQLSGGIHEYSEDVCLEKARQIDILLRYVIKKVNSEKFELIEVKKAMCGLKK